MSWLLISLFLLGHPVRFLVVEWTGPQTGFSGWTLRLEDGRILDFTAEGRVLLEEVEELAGLFEIQDGQGNLLFHGSWQEMELQATLHLRFGPGLIERELVVASRDARPLFATPGEVMAVNARDEAVRLPAQTADLLKGLAGVHLQKTNLGGGSPILRGVSGNRVLLSLDGFRLNNGAFRLGLNQYLNTVPLQLLDGMEVLAGASGVQYGSDGLGGTVLLRSRDPLASTTGLNYQGSARSGETSHEHALSGAWRGQSQALAGFAFARDHGDLRAGQGAVQSPTGYGEWGAGLQAAARTGERGRFRFNLATSRAQDVPRYDRVASGRDLRWNYQPQNLSFVTGQWEHQPEGALASWADRLELGLAYFHMEEGTDRISTGNPDLRQQTLDQVRSWQVQAGLHKLLGSLSLHYGLDGSNDAVAGKAWQSGPDGIQPQMPRFPDGARFGLLGAFFMAENHWGEGWFASAGSRFTHGILRGTLPEPFGQVRRRFEDLSNRLVLGRTWAENHLSLSLSEGFRMPSLEDALSFGSSSLGYDIPNPQLQPESVRSFDLTWRRRMGRVLGQAHLYHARYDQFMEREATTYQGSPSYQGEAVFRLANIAFARVMGGSLHFSGELRPGWAWQAELSAMEGEGGSAGERHPLTRSTPLRGGFRLGRQGSSWHWSADLHWAARQNRLSPADLADPRIGPEGTPGYLVLHLRAGWQPRPGLSLNVQLENLGDTAYRIHGSGIDEAGRRLGLGIIWRLPPASP